MDPPLVGVLCGKRHYTWPLIEASGEFALGIPHAGIVDQVLGLGATSGKNVADKFARFGLQREDAAEIGAPLVAEAAASLECRVEQIVDLGRSALILGQVVAARADERYFRDGEWVFDAEGFGLVHHVGGAHFAISDHVVTASVPEE